MIKLSFACLIVFLLLAPALSEHLYPEKYYQEKFCYGQTEFVLPDKTRVDCLTRDYAVEVDFASKWAECIGQSLYYAEMTNKKPACVLIIEDNKDYKHLYKLKKINKKHNITTWTIKPK